MIDLTSQSTLLSKIVVLVIENRRRNLLPNQRNGSCDIGMIQSFEKVQLVTNVPSGDLKMICSDFEKLKMELKKGVCCRRGKENYTEKYFFVEKNIPTWHKRYVQLVWVPRERKSRSSRSVQIAISLSMIS